MKKILTLSALAVAMLLNYSCSNDGDTPTEPVNPDPQEEPTGKLRLNVVSRASDNVVSTKVNVGLYMQHYEDGKMVDLLPAFNYLNNVKMTYDAGCWASTSPIYWFDATSLSDIYAYAPYKEQVADCRKMQVAVPTDQSTTEQLAAADLLWGRNLALDPTTSEIAVGMNHRLSRINIKVVPEADFAEGELKAEDLRLFVNNVRCEATMDLQTSDLTLTGEQKTILAHNNGNLTFTAIVMPQTVGFVNLLRLEWKDVVYTLQRSMTFDAQQNYDFTISINKRTASGLNIGITGWDIDGKDYGGVVE